jgi:hypothetical protein
MVPCPPLGLCGWHWCSNPAYGGFHPGAVSRPLLGWVLSSPSPPLSWYGCCLQHTQWWVGFVITWFLTQGVEHGGMLSVGQCKGRCRPGIQVDSRVPTFDRAPMFIHYMRGCARLCYSSVYMSISHCDYLAAGN